MPLEKISAIQRVRQWAAQGEGARAVQECSEIIKDLPDDPEIYLCLAELSLKQQLVPQALDAYQQAALLFARDGAMVEAVSCYKEMLKTAPYKAEAWARLGDAQARRGYLHNAIADYLSAAKLYLQDEEPAMALESYRKVLKLRPENMSARLRVAELSSAHGLTLEDATILSQDNDESDDSLIPGPQIDTLDQADDAPPVTPAPPEELDLPKELEEQLETYYQLALAYKEMGLLDEAIETFESVVQSPNRGGEACTLIAACYEDRNLKESAIAWLERAWRSPGCDGPLGLVVKHTLARLYENAGLAEKAACMYESMPGMRDLAERLRGK